MWRTWGSLLLLTLLLLKSTVVSSDAVFSRQDGAHNKMADSKQDGAHNEMVDNKQDGAHNEMGDSKQDGAHNEMADSKQDGAHNEMVDSKQDGGSVGEKQNGGRESAPEQHTDGHRRSLDTNGSIQTPVVVTDPMMASATSYGKGHKKGHKSKSHKSGYKSVKGKKGKKSHESKKGKKSDKKGHYKKSEQKKYHDKKGKKHKKDEHKKNYYGSVKKAKKGKKGFKHDSKGHHKKGHKDKGFKNVYHKEEYEHKKKFYDDKDLKKKHKKHEKGDKSFKGEKGKEYKGDKSKDLEYDLDPGLDAGSTEDSKDIKPKSLDQQIVDLKAAVRRLRMKLANRPTKNKEVARSGNTEHQTHKISGKKSISPDKKKSLKNDSIKEGRRHESKLKTSSSGGGDKSVNFTLMNTIARKQVNVRQAQMKKLKEQINKNRKGKPDKIKLNDVTLDVNDSTNNLKKTDDVDERTKSKDKLISKQDTDHSRKQLNDALKKYGNKTKGSIRSKNKKRHFQNKKRSIFTDKPITKRKTKHRLVRKSHAMKKPKEIKTQTKTAGISLNETYEEKTSNGTIEYKDGKKEATTETKSEENVKPESKSDLKTAVKKTGKSGVTGVKDSKKTNDKKTKASKTVDKKVKTRPARFKGQLRNVKYSQKIRQEKDLKQSAKPGRRHKKDTRKVKKSVERHHKADLKGKKAEKTISGSKPKEAKLRSKSAPSEGFSKHRISIKESHENNAELPRKPDRIKLEKDSTLVENSKGRQFEINSRAPHASERRTRQERHSKSQLKDSNLEPKQHRHRKQKKIRDKFADVPIKSKFRKRSKRESEERTKMTRDEHLNRVKRHFKEIQSKIRSGSISDIRSNSKTAPDKLSTQQEKSHGNSAKVSPKGTSTGLGSLENIKKSRTHKKEKFLPNRLVSSKRRNHLKEEGRKSSTKGRRSTKKLSASSKAGDTDGLNSKKNTDRISKHKTNAIKLRHPRFTIDLENPKFIPHLDMGIKYKDEFGKKGKSKKGHEYDRESDHKKDYDKKSYFDHKSKHGYHSEVSPVHANGEDTLAHLPSALHVVPAPSFQPSRPPSAPAFRGNLPSSSGRHESYDGPTSERDGHLEVPLSSSKQTGARFRPPKKYYGKRRPHESGKKKYRSLRKPKQYHEEFYPQQEGDENNDENLSPRDGTHDADGHEDDTKRVPVEASIVFGKHEEGEQLPGSPHSSGHSGVPSSSDLRSIYKDDNSFKPTVNPFIGGSREKHSDHFNTKKAEESNVGFTKLGMDATMPNFDSFGDFTPPDFGAKH